MMGFHFARAALLWLALSAVLSGCATSPLGNRQLLLFPESQMAQMGTSAYQQIRQQTPVSRNANVIAYVDCVAGHVTSALTGHDGINWEVTVFEDDQANAFALPGGKIGVYTGILEVAENQHQLAAIIGHEISHVTARHSNARVSSAFAADAGLQILDALSGPPSQNKQQLFGLLGVGTQVGVLLPFGRSQETEADLLGLDLMALAGFDPSESVTLWQNMAAQGGSRPPEFLSTHPSSDRRINDLRARLPRAEQLRANGRSVGRNPQCRAP